MAPAGAKDIELDSVLAALKLSFGVSALAAAIRRFVTEPGLADAMAAEARRIAPELAWTAVARRYGALGAALVAERAAALV